MHLPQHKSQRGVSLQSLRAHGRLRTETSMNCYGTAEVAGGVAGIVHKSLTCNRVAGGRSYKPTFSTLKQSESSCLFLKFGSTSNTECYRWRFQEATGHATRYSQGLNMKDEPILNTSGSRADEPPLTSSSQFQRVAGQPPP